MKRIYKKIRCLLLLLTASTNLAWATDDNLDSIFELSLEELANTPVYTLGKQTEQLKDSAAAVYIINQEDIRRSGAANLPELLRMVPGMQVLQASASIWGITARGFNSTRANKLLVLIDGRSIYTPIYAGVFWDQHDFLLDDIERIEVVRGPGGAIWGSNAVNGIVNIITKEAADSQGHQLKARTGLSEKIIGSYRFGGEFAKKTNYRAHVKYNSYDGSVFATNRQFSSTGLSEGDDAFDDWQLFSTALRVDHELNSSDNLSLMADYYKGKVDDAHNQDDEPLHGGSVNFIWDRYISASQSLKVQSYYNHFYRRDGDEPDGIVRKIDVADIDFIHSFMPFDNHALTWGLGYRFSVDDSNPGAHISLDPKRRRDKVASFFVQDKVELINETLWFTLGSKFEESNIDGFIVQPNVRLLGHVDEQNTLWAAISRSVRTPSRVEGGNQSTRTGGNSELDNEAAIHYELGHRYSTANLLLDSTIFYIDYDQLINVGSDTNPSISRYENMFKAESYGFESSLSWQVVSSWRLAAAYSYMDLQVHPDSRFTDRYSNEEVDETFYPPHQFNLRSYWNITSELELDLFLFYTDSFGYGDVDSHIRLDARLGWSPGRSEWSVGVQNGLDPSHSEQVLTRAAVEFERNYYIQYLYRF